MLIIDYMKHKAFSSPMPTLLALWVGWCLSLWIFAHAIYSFIAWDWSFYLPHEVVAPVRAAYAFFCVVLLGASFVVAYTVERE